MGSQAHTFLDVLPTARSRYPSFPTRPPKIAPSTGNQAFNTWGRRALHSQTMTDSNLLQLHRALQLFLYPDVNDGESKTIIS